jgi:hypothetical protein
MNGLLQLGNIAFTAVLLEVRANCQKRSTSPGSGVPQNRHRALELVPTESLGEPNTL